MLRAAAAGLVPLLLAACNSPAPPIPIPTPEVERPADGWRAMALPHDQDRLDRLALAWEAALADARAQRMTGRLRAAGPLVDPGAGLPRAMPPPGPYHCRLLRFGEGRGLIVYRPYFCDVVVEGPLLSLTKQDGSERPGGYLWSDGDARFVFLGAVAQGRERIPPAYGEDAARDLVGLFERIGPFRYRLVMPSPPSGSMLDILELVPFVADVP